MSEHYQPTTGVRRHYHHWSDSRSSFSSCPFRCGATEPDATSPTNHEGSPPPPPPPTTAVQYEQFGQKYHYDDNVRTAREEQV
jgi:hypothetical protein